MVGHGIVFNNITSHIDHIIFLLLRIHVPKTYKEIIKRTPPIKIAHPLGALKIDKGAYIVYCAPTKTFNIPAKIMWGGGPKYALRLQGTGKSDIWGWYKKGNLKGKKAYITENCNVLQSDFP